MSYYRENRARVKKYGKLLLWCNSMRERTALRDIMNEYCKQFRHEINASMPTPKDTNQTKKSIKKSRTSTDTKKQSKKGDALMSKEKTGQRMKDETRHTVYAVLSFILAAFFVMAGFKGAGPAGSGVYRALSALFGVGYILAPLLCVLLGLSFAKSSRPNVGFTNTLGSILFLIGALGLVDVATNVAHRGGLIGKFSAMPFLSLFGTYGSILFLGGILIIGLVVLFDTRPQLLTLWPRLRAFLSRDKEVADDEEEYEEEEEDDEPVEVPKKEEPVAMPILAKKVEEEEEFKPTKGFKHTSSYVPPPVSLLAGDRGKPQVGDVKANLNIIRRTLQNFGIEVEMDEVTIGPTVTRYALKPAEGVKLSRIVALQSDLALALAAHPIRIEAPIPGKSLVGIEIPNKSKSIVGLASLLSEEKFTHAEKALTVALGRNVAGKAIYANFAKMPHVLIAGATGSGKSVTIHAVVSSLLYRNGPEALRFIMIDPKRVELTLYNRIPHLLTPVITDPKKAILALKWAAKEMERRYDLLERNQVRDIESYHNNILAKGKPLKEGGEEQERMPYIVIIIDELADIMQSYPRELEAAIVRLAQMSRAVGIHLLLSTQRPSVNVITGLIKANVPARVALQVASQIDSRTILDAAGAEKLLGAGDMLYSAGDMGSPERLQSAFISEDEVKKMVAFIAEHNGEVMEGEIALTGNNLSKESGIFDATIGDEADDDMYEEARETVIQAGKASTSFLQRKLGVGYARAARLIDMLEERGVVGPGSGAKPRDVLEKGPESFRDEAGNNSMSSL